MTNLSSQELHEVGVRFKYIRSNLGFIQPEMAVELRISKSYYSKIEIGVIAPNDTLVELVCHKYHVRKDWLLSGTGDTYLSSEKEKEPEVTLKETKSEYHIRPHKLHDAIRIIADQMDVSEEKAGRVLGRVIADMNREEK